MNHGDDCDGDPTQSGKDLSRLPKTNVMKDDKSCSVPMESPPPSIGFTPINRRRPSSSITLDIKLPIQSDLALIEDEVSFNVGSAQPNHNQARCLKRNQSFSSDNGSSRIKRQLVWPAAPALSPFQSIKSTKCDSPSRTHWTSKYSNGDYHATQTTKTTMDQFTAGSTAGMSGQIPSSSDATNLYTCFFTPMNVDWCTSQSPYKVGETSNAENTAVPTSSSLYKQYDTTPNVNYEGTLPKSQIKTTGELGENEYPLDDILEEDMTLLFNTAEDDIQEKHIPPSSVTKFWDHDSRSAGEFDQNLQYSSPQSSSENCNTTNTKRDLGNETRGPMDGGEDLLDEEVDWNSVFVITSTAPKATSITGSPRLQQRAQPAPDTTLHQSNGYSYVVDDSMSLRPFPPKLIPTELSNLPSLTSNTVLRTCFRIGEMLSQTVRCHKLQQGVIFELFARVTYSSRERITRKQHFQFVDLEKDQQPYPSGILTSWKTGSHLDRQSLAFANTKAYPKLCWCLCQPRSDPKAAIGWTYTIISIKETDWRQVCLAKTVLSGSDSELSKGALMARL